jgi:hypothetical protein
MEPIDFERHSPSLATNVPAALLPGATAPRALPFAKGSVQSEWVDALGIEELKKGGGEGHRTG